MAKYACKYKNIADELKKRDPECSVEVNPGLESLVHMETGGNKEFNLCNDVLIALGYYKGPEIDGTIGMFDRQEPQTMGAYHQPWRVNHE